MQLEVLEVTRDFLVERGWPKSYEALKAFAGPGEPRVRVKRVEEGDFSLINSVWSAEPLNVAWFRAVGDTPRLYQQGWRGALAETA